MMTIVVERNYFPNGTNGALYIDNHFVCYTIELPWMQNQPCNSCIPEGSYPIKKRVSSKFGQHFLITNVPNRSLILIHPANHAKTELQGCIAPVTKLTGEGRGELSRQAFTNLKKRVNKELDRDNEVVLIIKNQQHDNS